MSSFLTTTLLVQNVTARGRAKQLHTFLVFNFKNMYNQKNKTFMFLFEKIEKKEFSFLFYCFNVFKAIKLCVFLVPLEAAFSEHGICLQPVFHF